MTELISKVKKNLIIDHDEDDDLIHMYICTAMSYAEKYQHLEENYYSSHDMSPSTEHGVIMLASHFYENRDGSSGGFFGNTPSHSEEAVKIINDLLRLDRDWKV